MREFEIVEDRETQNGKITVYDDGKEKHNSHEARLCISSNIPGGSIELELEVFEDSRENALIELNIAFVKLMEKFKEDWNLKEPYDD